MNKGKMRNRRAAEAVLAICAAIIWAYNFHMIYSHEQLRSINPPAVAMNPEPAAETFPWESTFLPRIGWNPFPVLSESPAQSSPEQDLNPRLLLQGLYYHGPRKAAIVRELDNGEMKVLFEGESWNGTTLQKVGQGWVTIKNGNRSWKIMLPSQISPDR